MILRYARLLAAVFLLLSLAISAAVSLAPGRGLLDFGAFYMAGVAQEKGVEDPYGVYPELAAETGANFGHTDGRGHSPNLNPPISLYPFRLLAGVDPAGAKVVLNVASVLVFAGCALVMLRAYPAHRNALGVLWIAASGGFWYTLWLGQLYVLLFALGLGAWLLIQRRSHPLVAGVLLGLLVAVKPHFLLWPLFLLLAGHPRVAVTAFAVAAAVSLVPLTLEGPEVYRQWLAAAEAYPRIALDSNVSLVGEAARLGIPEAGYALGAVLVGASALLMYLARPNPTEAGAWAIVVALLASPIAWVGYGLLLLPVLLTRRWDVLEWLAALGLTGIWFALGRGEPFLLAALVVLYLNAKDLVMHRQVSFTAHEVPRQDNPEQVAA